MRSLHGPSFGALLWGALACLSSASLPALADPAPAATASSSVLEAPAEDEGSGEADSVSVTFFRARAVDSSGRPLLGLEPKDLSVNIGGREVPVTAVDWYADPLSLPDEVDRPEALVPATDRGQLFAFLVDIEPGSHLGAQLEARRQYFAAVRRLVEDLPERAYAAVLWRDEHLKLRQDFTTDKKLVFRAIQEAARSAGAEPAPAAEAGRTFLAAHFDEDRARLAVGSERALVETARALEPLPGEKVLIYLRVGQGRFEEIRGVTLGEEMVEAILALQEARTAFFAFDHYGLDEPTVLAVVKVANSTGGWYMQARSDPHPAAKRLTQTIRGYYLVTLDSAALPQEDLPRQMSVKLTGKKGEVLAAPFWTVTKSPVD